MKFAEPLEQIVKTRIEKDSLTLPALPAVAFKCLELTRMPDFNMTDVEAESQITQRNPKLWIDFPTWIDVVQRCHRPIGLDLARKWQLPDESQQAIEECADYDPANRLSIGNAVRFANAVAKQQGIYAGTVNADDNDALVMVGRSLLGIDDETLTRLSSDLKEESREAA